MARSLFDKLWDAHVVVPESEDAPAILFIDLHLVHEVTSPQAFAVLEERGLKVRRPDLTQATLDHSTPTLPADADGRLPYATEAAERQVHQLEANCAKHGIDLLGLDDARRGIVHVIGPEMGLTQPGKTIVCGDSHTSTHGAFGALAFGIGTTEVGHVLATQCVLQRKPKSMRITFEGALSPGVGAKDMALAMIAQIGADAGFDDVALEKYHWVEKINHVHHAGNSSGIVDGAALMAIGTEEIGAELGLTPRARIVSMAVSGADPTIMLTGPAPAARKALAKAGLETKDIDLFEINEAFAAVAMRFMRDMGITDEITNVNGGAIAMGHPLGATGAMILGTLIDELQRRDQKRGLATLCVGGGMGIATIVEIV